MVNYTFSLANFEYFLLILVRIASFIFAAPFFSLPNVPRRVKIAFSCFLAIMVTTLLHPENTTSYSSVIGYAAIVIKEATTGLLIGFVANICSNIIIFSGNVIDMDIGLSMATEFDPSMKTSVTLTGQMYYYFLNMMLIVTGMYQYVIRAVMDSFTSIPVGGAIIRPDNLLHSMISFMSNMFIISFRIILPVFACTMILNVVLGVIAKVAPQMNMFSVGIQMKMLLGFGILLLTTFLFPHAADMIFTEMRQMTTSVIRGMS
jgi:flagellar biosynthetic protein FliR